MQNLIKKPYELSLWQDIPVYHIQYLNRQDSQGELIEEEFEYELPTITEAHRLLYSYFKEKKVAVIGSYNTSSPIQAMEPKLVSNINGSNTLTFTMYSKYWDEGHNHLLDNTFTQLLKNEAKLKLQYGYKRDENGYVYDENNQKVPQWYDFIIQNITEASKDYKITYTATDVYINELSKAGYSLTFNTDLGNNSGNIIQLARNTLLESDWDALDNDGKDKNGVKIKLADGTYPKSTNIRQTNEEALYELTILEDENIYALDEEHLGESGYLPIQIFGSGKVQLTPAEVKAGPQDFIRYQIPVVAGEQVAYITLAKPTAFDEFITYYKKVEDKENEYEEVTEDEKLQGVDPYVDYYVYSQHQYVLLAHPTIFRSDITYYRYRSNHIYVFYSTLTKKEEYFQFYYNESDTFETKDDRIIQNSPTYCLTNSLGKLITAQYLDNESTDEDLNPFGYRPSFARKRFAIEPRYRGKKKVRSARVSYDPVINKTVTHYKHTVGSIVKDARGYTKVSFVSPTTLQNYIANSTDYPSSEGWLGVDIGQGQTGSVEWYSWPDYDESDPYLNKIYHNTLKMNLSDKKYVYNNSLALDGFNTSFYGNVPYVFRWKGYSQNGSTLSPLNTLGFKVASYHIDNGKYIIDKVYFDVYQGKPGVASGIGYDECTKLHYGRYVNKNTFYDENGIQLLLKSNEVYINVFNSSGGRLPVASYTDYRANLNGELVQTFEKYYYLRGQTLASLIPDDYNNTQVGIFLYRTDTTAGDVYFEDIQFFKYYPAKGDTSLAPVPLTPSSLQEGQEITTYYYYDYDPLVHTIDEINFTETTSPDSAYQVEYDDSFTKIRTINIEKSNWFNILQTLCEQFECWAKFIIDHDPKTGEIVVDHNSVVYVSITKNDRWENNQRKKPITGITYYIYNEGTQKYDKATSKDFTTDGYFKDELEYYTEEKQPRQRKYVIFQEFAGGENSVGFKYGVNLTTIQRTINSKQIVSKLIVEQNNNAAAPNGICTIQDATQNALSDNTLYNFNYYFAQGLLNSTQVDTDLHSLSSGYIGYYVRMPSIMARINNYQKTYANYANTMMSINAGLQVTEKDINANDTQMKEIVKQVESFTGDSFSTVSKSTEWQKNTYVAGRLKSYSAANSALYHAVVKRDSYQTQKNNLEPKMKTIELLIGALTNEARNLKLRLQNKYGRFLQEGTWISEDYYDPNLYYLDAESLLNDQCLPAITYNISAVELGALEDYENYSYNLGDRTFIEDVEFFGYAYNMVYNTASDRIDGKQLELPKRPFKQDIIVTEIQHNLDTPDKDSITVRTYKNQFADLFQKIAATTQSLQYSQGSYDKAANILNGGEGTTRGILAEKIQENLDIADIMTNADYIYEDPDYPNYRLKIGPTGIKLSSDGGITWSTAITGRGFSASLLTSGTINTNQINLYSDEARAWSIGARGMTAFYHDDEVEGSYADDQFVRFDSMGMYGVKHVGADELLTIDDLPSRAQFGLTWNGFFLNTGEYQKVGDKWQLMPGGIKITSDNDILVQDNSGSERVKIGRLVEPSKVTPSNPQVYGIRISDKDGNIGFMTDESGKIRFGSDIALASPDQPEVKAQFGILGYYASWNESKMPPVPQITDSDHAVFRKILHAGSLNSGQSNFQVFDDGTVLASRLFLTGGKVKIGDCITIDAQTGLTMTKGAIQLGEGSVQTGKRSGTAFYVGTDGKLKANQMDLYGGSIHIQGGSYVFKVSNGVCYIGRGSFVGGSFIATDGDDDARVEAKNAIEQYVWGDKGMLPGSALVMSSESLAQYGYAPDAGEAILREYPKFQLGVTKRPNDKGKDIEIPYFTLGEGTGDGYRRALVQKFVNGLYFGTNDFTKKRYILEQSDCFQTKIDGATQGTLGIFMNFEDEGDGSDNTVQMQRGIYVIDGDNWWNIGNTRQVAVFG